MTGCINGIVNQVCSRHPEINKEKYFRQVSIVYGALSDTYCSDPKLNQEIIEMEEERISRNGINIESSIRCAIDLLVEYSTISFSLAKKSLFENKGYGMAQPLKELLNGLLTSGSISMHDQREYKHMISETELDFEFASGNHEVSSLRMSQIIRDFKVASGNN